MVKKKLSNINFEDVYNHDILPVLQKYESYRRSLFLKALSGIFIAFVGGVGLFYLCKIQKIYEFFFNNESSIGFYLFIALIVVDLTVLTGVPAKYYNKFKTVLKHHCRTALKRTFSDIKWGKSSINDYIIKESQLFGAYNNISYDDRFSGKYHDIEYSVTEANMLYITQGRYKMVYPVFDGVIISFSSNKNIQAHTMVTTKGDNSIKNYNPALRFLALLLVFSAWFGLSNFSTSWYIWLVLIICFTALSVDFYKKWKNFQSVKLEDLNFDKRFSVFSKDQIEARYLLTTSFMDRLYNLGTAFGTQKVKCAFFEDQIVFAISTKKDLFEPGEFHRSLLNKKKVKEFYDEIMAIYNMIEYFKLDKNTGL